MPFHIPPFRWQFLQKIFLGISGYFCLCMRQPNTFKNRMVIGDTPVSSNVLLLICPGQALHCEWPGRSNVSGCLKVKQSLSCSSVFSFYYHLNVYNIAFLKFANGLQIENKPTKNVHLSEQNQLEHVTFCLNTECIYVLHEHCPTRKGWRALVKNILTLRGIAVISCFEVTWTTLKSFFCGFVDFGWKIYLIINVFSVILDN